METRDVTPVVFGLFGVRLLAGALFTLELDTSFLPELAE